jgi:dipeptidyl-peptidase-4
VTRLTVERLFSSPSLNGSVPTQVRFSPDGLFVTYLANPPEDRERLDLYAYEIASGASSRLIDASRTPATGEMTDAEKAERERRRQFSGGLSSYRWLPDARHICGMIDGTVYLFDRENDTLRAMTAEGLRQTDLTLSPGGRYLSYVRGGDLYLYDIGLAREERLTLDASECVTNGLAEFVAQEEMHRFEGHWWSPDDAHIVFTRVDSSAIPETRRYEFMANELVAVPQRYPYAGSANARVDLGVIDLHRRSVHWIEYRHRPDDYLARVNVAASHVAVQVQSRDQHTLTLTAFPFDDEASRELLTEQQPAWVNLHNNFRFVGGSSDFLWTSERTGTSQLYLYRADGTSRQLTRGTGRINEVVHADATHAFVLGWTERPTEQHLMRVSLGGIGEPEILTKQPGWHEAVVDPTGGWFVDRYSNVRQPVCLVLHSLATEAPPRPLAPNALVEGHPYFVHAPNHATPSFGSFAAPDGQALWYRLTLPRNAKERVPVLVNVYGGPGVQRVRDEWAPLTNQLFAGLGIAVFELDNRGGANRAKSFEDPIKGRLGHVEVDDQLAAIEFIGRQPWADADRIGVIGHSYGGFMTLMLMARNSGQIRCGISTAPVTDWRLYDTHYTERYLSTPQSNADGYRDSCVLSHVDAISGALLLMHGMADDNVLFANSSALMKSLQKRGFPFELMLYPGAKHAMQEPDVSIHRYHTILDFLQRKLLA